MGERVVSVALPAPCWPNDARHFARHSCPPLLRAPPPFPSMFLCPRFCPLGVLVGSTRLLVGLLPTRVWGGGAPDAGSGPSLPEFPHGGGRCMHSLSGCNSVVQAVHLYPLRTNGPAP